MSNEMYKENYFNWKFENTPKINELREVQFVSAWNDLAEKGTDFNKCQASLESSFYPVKNFNEWMI